MQNVKAQSLQLVLLGLGLLQPGLAQERAVQSLELTVEGQTTPPTTTTLLEAGEHIVQCTAIGFSPWNLMINFTMWAQPSARGQPRGNTMVISDTELSGRAGTVLYRASQYFAIQVKRTTTSLSCYEDESFKGPPVTTTLHVYKCSLHWVEPALNDNPRSGVTSPGCNFRQPYHDTIRCEASLFCGGSTLASVPHPIQFEVWLDKKKLDIPLVTDVRIQQRMEGVHSVAMGLYDVQQNFSTDFTKKDHGKNVTCIETITGMKSRVSLMLCDPPGTTATTTTTTTTTTTNTPNITTKDLNVGSSKGKTVATSNGLAIGLGIGGAIAVLTLATVFFVFAKNRELRVEPGGSDPPSEGRDRVDEGPSAVTVSETTGVQEYDVPIESEIASLQAGEPSVDV
ncbi:hypothetical protein V1264_017271 [Littorina saxatilis]